FRSFFFFQAEDGIRAGHVTGVQTCALPISGFRTPRTVLARDTVELRAALPCFPAYLLKPAYSRFATQIITNCGPRAGQLLLDSRSEERRVGKECRARWSRYQ